MPYDKDVFIDCDPKATDLCSGFIWLYHILLVRLPVYVTVVSL